MEEHWYVSPEVLGSSPGPVKVFFDNLSICSQRFPVSFSFFCLAIIFHVQKLRGPKVVRYPEFLVSIYRQEYIAIFDIFVISGA